MQLKVVHHPYHPDDLGGETNITIKSFRDIQKIGAEVARGVREWLRRIPLTPQTKSLAFTIAAEWIEDAKPPKIDVEKLDAPRPKRKRKARK